ncbi:hypothetical protein AA313_de0205012 [Arthrobotrys entomopaga]|nr:hypothetical protein AA313_de0205012 [Arthrobotrys entomopaga]
MASTETLARLGKKREALDQIVSSRKRKLQELYRVVNHVQLSCTATRGGRTAGPIGRLGWDEDGEKKFLESTDINLLVSPSSRRDSYAVVGLLRDESVLINRGPFDTIRGKAFNANEMLPKPTLVVPDVVREALKSIVPAVQKGDALSTVVTKGEGSAINSENAVPTKPTEGLNVPSTRDTQNRRSLTPKPSAESENITSNLEDSMIHVGKTPVRRVARQKPPSTEETTLRLEGNYSVVSKETIKESKLETQVHRSQNDAKDAVMEDARPTVAKISQEDILLSEEISDSTKPQSALFPTKSTDNVTPPPLQRTTSQKSEQPNLAISTQTSPQDQISRPFPTPTTATEAEHSVRPPASIPEKSISPPSPADSATLDITTDGNAGKVLQDTQDEAGEVEDDLEIGGQVSVKASEIQTESMVTNEHEVLEPKSADEVMGEVEKQLQVETALSKQQEIPKEDQIPSTDDMQHLPEAEGAAAQLSDVPLSEDIEMGDPSAENINTTEQEKAQESTTIPADPCSQIKDTPETTQIDDNEIGSQETSAIQATADAKIESVESAPKQPQEKEHMAPSSEISRENTAVTNIKREEQTPLETLEPANISSFSEHNLSATPAVIPATPHHITHEADVIDGSALAETPMSVDESAGHATSPKFVQQPLTTAALESINTTASTPATRASSRREKRPSITGGLQLAKIVFHGRSTANASSKSDSNPNELSPSAPTPVRVGTRSGSIGTPARMNSRSLEAQRISSLAEIRDQHQSQSRQQSAQHHKSGSEKSKLDVFDYLTAVTASEPLQNSLATSHKTLSTSAFQLLRREKQAIQALTEIQELQKAGKWSLTQPAKAIEPPKQIVHWDYLLMEAKWMSKDFKEDRKWNIVRAKKLADACMAWHQSGPEERKAMCIRTMGDSSSARNSRQVRQMPTPNEHSDDDAMRDDDDDGDENMRDDFVHRLHEVENPGNLFALGADDIIFEILHNSMTDRMLGELPIFEAPKLVDGSGKVREPVFFDGWKNNEPLAPSGLKRTLWETPAEEGPPVKKSRFSYDPEYKLLDSDDEDEENREPIRRVGGTSRGIARSGSPVLQPENTAVALFNPDFQPVLQRLHNAHPFRPPQEMPPATFFEYRAPSQWTAEEDKELVNTVRKYNHNWWLVSQVMQPRSFLQSGADRRSLWECFERWFMLDPQNQELIKGPFFKPVQQRLELASRAPTLAVTTAQQQAANNATAATPGGANATGQSAAGAASAAGATASTPGQPPKRRTSQPMRVERKRSTRTLNMIEQMRKLAKKREVQASKQAQSTSIALKKQQEQSAQAAAAPKSEQYTPLQVSRMKHERELLHRQQAQMAQMAQLQRRQTQNQTSSSTAAPGQPSQAATAGSTTSGTAAASTPTAATPVQSNNNIPVQSRNNLQVPGVQSTPAAAVPTTAQQSLLAAQQQRSLMSASSNAAVQAATQQVNQHLRAQGHTIASNGQNGPTSLTPEQYRMLIQARMQANAIKMQQVQAQAQAQAQAAAAAGHGSPQSVSASANHLHAMQAAAAAARAHNSNSGQAGQVNAGSSGANRGDLISAQQAMMRIKQSFPTIGDEYVHRMIMQHQAQAKQLGKELTYGHISNLIASLASQFQGVGQQQAAAAAQQQQAQLQQAAAVAQQQQQQQQQAAAAQAAAAHHHQQGHSQSPPHPGMVGVAHVGAGGIHHPHPPISRGGASAAAQQMLNQLMISQTRAPSSSPMMGNATPVMSSAGVVSRGSSATPMQRGGSYHTPTPGSAGTSAGAMGQQGSPRIGQSQMPNGGQ